jgi:hypothetical protein
VDNCINGEWQICDPFEGYSDEVCDDLDNDCNGEVDDIDVDGDGYSACIDDCDDSDPGVNPGVEEVICDGIDNDCDPLTPDEPDEDGDGWTVCAGDCDDNDAEVNPGMTEIPYNGKDDDCDPTTRDELAPAFERAVCVEELLNMYNNTLVGSYETAFLDFGDRGEALSRGDMNMENHATVAGRAVVWGDLAMVNNTLITVDALVGVSIIKGYSASIDGDQIVLEQEPPSCAGDYDLDAVMDWVAENNDNNDLQNDPDIQPYLNADGGMVIKKNRTVVLPGGVYHLEYLEVARNAQVTIEEGAWVHLFVEGRIHFHNNASIRNGPDHPDHLFIITGADAQVGEEVLIRNHTELGLYLYAPFADITLENNASIFGGVICRRLTMENHTEVLQPEVEPPSGPGGSHAE